MFLTTMQWQFRVLFHADLLFSIAIDTNNITFKMGSKSLPQLWALLHQGPALQCHSLCCALHSCVSSDDVTDVVEQQGAVSHHTHHGSKTYLSTTLLVVTLEKRSNTWSASSPGTAVWWLVAAEDGQQQMQVNAWWSHFEITTEKWKNEISIAVFLFS